jgi:hypothetical protein
MGDAPDQPRKPWTATLLRGAQEALVLGSVVILPWVFGGDEPVCELAQDVVVALLLTLWAGVVLAEWRFTWQACPVLLCLVLLFFLGLWQLAPLPHDLLSAVAPETARTYERLLPARPEILADGEGMTGEGVGTTISLYPGGTRRQTVKLLGVILLFAVVRQQLVSARALYRLSVAATANGALLGLLGLMQSLSRTGKLYWTYPSVGPLFGPSNNRNVIAYYLTVCLILGIGLFFCRLRQTRRSSKRQGNDEELSLARFLAPLPFAILAAIVLTATALVYTQCRAAMVACGAALVLFVAFSVRRGRGLAVLPVVGGLVLLVAVVSVSTGFDWSRSRQFLLLEGDAKGLDISSGRFDLWTRSVNASGNYLPWGIGYGSSPSLLQMRYTEPTGVKLVGMVPHNIYLEALLEGGLAGGLLAVVATVLVFLMGARAFRLLSHRPERALAAGGVFAFTATVVLNCFNNGLHNLANRVLVTVLCAYLSGLGARRAGSVSRSRPPTPEPPDNTFRLGIAAPPITAILLVALALSLVAEGWRLRRAQEYLLAAMELSGQKAADDVARRKTLLESAARLFPQNWRMECELGEAYLDGYYTQGIPDSYNRQQVLALASAVLAEAGTPAGAGVVPSWLPPFWTLRQRLATEELRDRRRRLTPALRHFLYARDLCPLAPIPQIRIASLADLLEEGDPPTVYRDRALAALPTDPELAFLCGYQDLREGQAERAAAAWKSCLQLLKGKSQERQKDILAEMGRLGADTFTPKQWAEDIVPPSPDLLALSALALYPGRSNVERRQPFLEKATDLFKQSPNEWSPRDHFLRGVLQDAQDLPIDAIRSMKTALALDPGRNEWRMEFARLLYHNRLFREARREVEAVLSRTPNDENAKKLWKEIMRGPTR